jgi:hypothetical protein
LPSLLSGTFSTTNNMLLRNVTHAKSDRSTQEGRKEERTGMCKEGGMEGGYGCRMDGRKAG